MAELAIALGIALNLVIGSFAGWSSAGLVVPGYLALYLHQPGRIAATFLSAGVTWLLVRFGLERLVVLYGRRRLAVTVLLGFVVNAMVERLLPLPPFGDLDLRVIGFIVPGLIAGEALSQGVWPTVLMTLLVAALVRIVLVLSLGVLP